jgi:nickel-dependent lactate racemase
MRMKGIMPLATFTSHPTLPDDVVVLEPQRVPPLGDVPTAIAQALERPVGTRSLTDVAHGKLAENADARAVVVVSDSTRPVPYSGPSGILWPMVERLLDSGFTPDRVTLIVATGTHRRLNETEIGRLYDGRVLSAGIAVRCHDAFDPAGLVSVGRTAAGVDVLMDSEYAAADLRILTGLVESHLMAGASGGRKSICPGLLGVDSVRDFHGARVLADPMACDLVTTGNPCHDLALEIARMAPADFIINVTCREDGAVMGVFAGDMEEAHAQAVADLRRFVSIPAHERYDVVVTHGGKVGVNHYQAAKAAAVAAMVVKPGGYIILVADTIDPDPIGSAAYRSLLGLLREIGADAFVRLILGPDWTFVHDQWQVQMWARVFAQIPPHHFLYFSPQTPTSEYDSLPGRSPGTFFAADRAGKSKEEQVTGFVAAALRQATAEWTRTNRPGPHDRALRPRVAFLPAGPYAIPTLDTR